VSFNVDEEKIVFLVSAIQASSQKEVVSVPVGIVLHPAMLCPSVLTLSSVRLAHDCPSLSSSEFRLGVPVPDTSFRRVRRKPHCRE